MDSFEHVAYLGAFVVSGQLWRGDLFRDEDGKYWAEHTVTKSDGSWMTARHHVIAEEESEAVSAAFMAALEYFIREGCDVGFMSVIHYAPGAEGALKQIRQQSSAPALLQ